MIELFNTALAIGILLLGAFSIVSLVLALTKHEFATVLSGYASLILRVILVGSVLGSMTYELVFGYAPCLLCWYQRMTLFPLAILVFTENIKTNKLLQKQVLLFASLGFAVSLFHNFIDIFPGGPDVCGAGPSCLLRYVHTFGFVTIPLMSAITLFSVLVFTYIARRYPHGPIVQ